MAHVIVELPDGPGMYTVVSEVIRSASCAGLVTASVVGYDGGKARVRLVGQSQYVDRVHEAGVFSRVW